MHMNSMKTMFTTRFLVLIAGTILLSVTAQAQRGGFDRGQMMERLSERYQEVLEVSDDEWSVLKPMIIGIVEKQFSGRSSRFSVFSRGGGRGGRGGDGNRSSRGGRGADNPLSKAIEKGDDGAIKSALAAHRSEQKKQAAELKKARNDLRQLLTLKQEANLVLMGLLE